MKYRVHLVFVVRGAETALAELADRVSGLLRSLETDAELFTDSSAAADRAAGSLHVDVVTTGAEPYQLAAGAAEHAVKAVATSMRDLEVGEGVDVRVAVHA